MWWSCDILSSVQTLAAVSESKTKKWLYETGFNAKLLNVKRYGMIYSICLYSIIINFLDYRGIITNNSFWDYLVFRKIQKMLGGRVRMIISGSAPLGSAVADFLRVAFGCQVRVMWLISLTLLSLIIGFRGIWSDWGYYWYHIYTSSGHVYWSCGWSPSMCSNKTKRCAWNELFR